MSGFEVAGIVLGSFPIIVGALELYVSGVSTFQKWRVFKRRLKSFLNSVETEQVKLKNVYEKLLWGIAPPTQIEEMINDPFGPLWRSSDMNNKVRQRLGRSLKVFERTVEELSEILEETKEKLGVQWHGKVDWAEHTNFKRELKRIAFILQSSDYQELLSRMRDGVSNLERLLTLDLEMEPNRQRLSKARLSRLVQNVSASLHHALSFALACKCPNVHEVGLRLTPRLSVLTSGDEDEDIIKDMKFHVVLSHHLEPLEINVGVWNRVKRWTELVVRPVVTGPQAGEEPDSIPNSSARRNNNLKRKGVVVRFSLSTDKSTPGNHPVSSSTTTTTTTTSALAQTMAAALGPLEILTPKEIKDLCQILPELLRQRRDQCCGYITDSSIAQNTRRYGVYPRDDGSDNGDWSVISLRKILSGGSGSAPSLHYGDRLRLAWTVASSALQLHSTPWVPAVLTLDEIFLIKRNGQPVYQDAIVITRLPAPPSKEQPPAATKNGASFTLGILLIELILSATIETFRPAPQDTAELYGIHVLDDYETAMKLFNKVNTIAGANYDTAVRRCFRCEYSFYPNSQQEGESSCTNVLIDVVSLLEEDLKNSGTSCIFLSS